MRSSWFRAGIPALLAVVLVAGSVLGGIVVAQSAGNISANDDYTSLGGKEKEIISKTMSPEKYNKDISRKAEIARKMTEIEIKKQIERSLKDSYFTLAGTGTVYLGTDTTFYDASHGDSGTSSTGACPFFYGSDYYITANKAEAATVLGPGGYCSKGAWAWIGKSFYVSGSGSQTANIIQRGHIWGLTSAAAGGSSHAEIKFVVKDLTTGAEYSTTIYSKSEGGVGWTEVNRDYTKGITVNLQAGHTYIAYLLVETSGAIYGIGEAGSDFGRQDGDYVGEGAWYYSITIDF